MPASKLDESPNSYFMLWPQTGADWSVAIEYHGPVQGWHIQEMVEVLCADGVWRTARVGYFI